MTPDESLTPTPALIAHLEAVVPLVAIATAGVWMDPAPDKGDAIYVTVNLQSDLVQRCGGGCRWHDCVYAVQAIGPAAQVADLRRAAVLIRAALLDGTLTLPGWHVMGRRLEEPIEFADPKTATGLGWEHRGGQYRLMVEEICG
jgi:hypothetical protein